jgi:hypothetical protein
MELSPRFRHRTPAPSQSFQQRKILHVARAHLENVGVLGNQVYIAIAHHLGNDPETGSLLRSLQQLQTVGFHSLEVVGRGSRLECSAAQQMGARRCY